MVMMVWEARVALGEVPTDGATRGADGWNDKETEGGGE